MIRTALITGITGQDGAYLARFLLDKGYDVHGLRLYSAVNDLDRIGAIKDHPRLHLHFGDLIDGTGLMRLMAAIKPDELYNLAAQSHVAVSYAVPEATANINALGALRLLEAVRLVSPATRFYQASSSEMFGSSPAPQNEQTPFQPCSPYGCAKLYAYWTVRNYRDSYGLHASNGILFNHESPLRGEDFVTQKIAKAVAAIEAGKQECLMLGNLNAKRDWGHTQDYVEGMWAMLQQDAPDDYVLATGQTRTVRDFVEAAFSCVGVMLRWQGQGVDEQGMCAKTGKILVAVDAQFFRPNEVHILCGDATKAKETLKWTPRIGFADMVHDMVQSEREGCEHEKLHVAA